MAKVVITIEDVEDKVDIKFSWKEGWPSPEQFRSRELTDTQLYGTTLMYLAHKDRLDRLHELVKNGQGNQTSEK